MKTPEDVAREYYPECLQVTEPEGSKFAGERFCQSHHVRWVRDLDMCPVQHILWLTIRDRDAEIRVDAYARALAYLASAHGNLQSNGDRSGATIAQGWLIKAQADLLGGGDAPG